MAADASRIDELRRRVQQDPASIVFAQLAEEYRRSGHADAAVPVCRAGLVHHPSYISARVTLGRALMALDRDEEAKAEFEHVLRAAPDNLLACRCLEELQQRQPATPPAGATETPATAAPNPVLQELEGWLAAIAAHRENRGVERPPLHHASADHRSVGEGG